MNVTRYRSGDATVILTGDLEALARRVVSQAAKGTVEALEKALEPVRARAEAVWYTEVERQTGQSGTLAVATTIDGNRDRVTVSLGSTDARKDKRGRPAVAFIHRPRALSTVAKEITSGEYHRMKSLGGINADLVFQASANAVARDPKLIIDRYYRKVGNPQASDGKVLLQVHIRAPGKAAVMAASAAIAGRIAQGVNRGG